MCDAQPEQHAVRLRPRRLPQQGAAHVRGADARREAARPRHPAGAPPPGRRKRKRRCVARPPLSTRHHPCCAAVHARARVRRAQVRDPRRARALHRGPRGGAPARSGASWHAPTEAVPMPITNVAVLAHAGVPTARHRAARARGLGRRAAVSLQRGGRAPVGAAGRDASEGAAARLHKLSGHRCRAVDVRLESF